MTFKFTRGVDQVYWTPEYSICYIFAPLIGAFVAGNVFNFSKKLTFELDNQLIREVEETETDKNKNFKGPRNFFDKPNQLDKSYMSSKSKSSNNTVAMRQ